MCTMVDVKTKLRRYSVELVGRRHIKLSYINWHAQKQFRFNWFINEKIAIAWLMMVDYSNDSIEDTTNTLTTSEYRSKTID